MRTLSPYHAFSSIWKWRMKVDVIRRLKWFYHIEDFVPRKTIGRFGVAAAARASFSPSPVLGFALWAQFSSKKSSHNHLVTLSGSVRVKTPSLLWTDRTRQLCALSRSLKELKTFYETLDFNHNIDPADLALPYPTQIPNEPPFRYMIPFLDDSRKAIFKGKRSCGKSIVVKFTDRYNEKAHRILAKHGLAPQLLHIQSIGGGLTMVVMDLVRGLTLDEVTRDSISPRRIVMRCARRSNSCTKKISYLEIYDLPMFYFPTTGVRF
ncbi:hypothetical protein FRB95_008258 [Tulasnella sp. JGI-2019a]|nr:hypothetical protein FRB95_008258 [Tulasnella sp. JGI-2019a]